MSTSETIFCPNKGGIMAVPAKIGIIRFSSIGDIVLTMPAVHELKRIYPNSSLHYITKESFGSLVENDPAIAKVHLLDTGSDLAGLIEKLKAEQFDLIVDLHDNLRSRTICSKLKVPVKRYTKDRLRRMNYLWFKKREPVTPIWKRYCESFSAHATVPDFSVNLPKPTRIKAVEILGETPTLVIAPGSTWVTKEWPIHKYRELGKLLADQLFPVAVIGGTKDVAVQEVLAESMGDRLIPLAGKLSITESAAIVAKAAMVLTVDTGMMHIGSAFDRPMIVLFGSTVQEFGFFPVSTRATVVQRDLNCRPCSHTGKKSCPKKHFNCMNEISSEDIATKILTHFKGKL